MCNLGDLPGIVESKLRITDYGTWSPWVDQIEPFNVDGSPNPLAGLSKETLGSSKFTVAFNGYMNQQELWSPEDFIGNEGITIRARTNQYSSYVTGSLEGIQHIYIKVNGEPMELTSSESEESFSVNFSINNE